MTDQRCPMCGKDNPPDREICQFCEARLKPLVGSPSAGRDDPERPEEPAPFETGPEPQDELGDWLEDLRQQDSEPPSDQFEAGNGEDADDWLDRMRSEAEEEDEAPAPLEDEEELGSEEDYQARLDAFKEQETPPEEPAPPAFSFEQDDEEVPLEAFETRETPGLSFRDEAERRADEPEGDQLPDWLSEEIEDEQSPEDFFREEFEAAGEEDEGLPDWLQEAAEGEEGQAFLFEEAEEASAEDLEPPEAPDFTFQKEFEEGEEEKAEGVPDWLQEVAEGEEQEAISLEAPDEVPPEAFETKEIPGLTFQEETEDLDQPAIQGPVEGTASQWLEELAADIPEPDEEAPEWFAEQAPSEEEPVSLQDEDVPDWLRSLQAVQKEAEVEDLEEVEDVIREPASPDETPAWLSELEEKVPEVYSEPEGAQADLQEESVPPIAPETQQPEIEEAAVEDMPGWVSETPAERQEAAAEAPETADEELDLAPAELPGWLKAMRPVEAVTSTPALSEEVDQGVEGVGPLAGLQGILPAEPEIAQAGATGAYSVRVQITENQEKNISILKDLVRAEVEPSPAPSGRLLFASQHILRWLIGLMLILAIGYSWFTASQAVPLPVQVPDEVFGVGNVIGRLSTGSPVLLAFDYQPGLSGEMESAATAVFQHLALQSARIAMVSTTPSGPLLAERFIDHVGRGAAQDYRHGEQYVNLGFIPGEAVGLQNFVMGPRQALPVSFNREGVPDGVSVWATPVLQDVQDITDFALVLVLADDPERARQWIEQVQPHLGATPLAMVISAQAEPLVRPFYQASSRQVSGYVSGIAGGAAYETFTGREQVARGYWDAFSLGVLLAAVLIIGGAVYSIFLALWKGSEPVVIAEEQG